MAELGLHGVLAGIYVLRGVDAPALEQIVQATTEAYVGPDVGGLDVMLPDGDGVAWLLLGRWTDCFATEVQEAAELLLERLRDAALARDAGVEVVPWIVVHGGIAEGITTAQWQRWLGAVFPRVPSWIGMHMGAPHWLGVGVSLREGRIDQVTPYARLDLRADGTVMFTGVAEDAVLRGWFPKLKAAIEV
jgi:hypothetical protein